MGCQARKDGFVKVKLLWVGDYSNTGFGTVAKGLLRELHSTGRYDILQLGINFRDGQASPELWPIIPAGKTVRRGKTDWVRDPYGIKKLDKVVKEFDPDIVIVNNDYPIARTYMTHTSGRKKLLARHRSIKVLYAPVDSEPAPAIYGEVAKQFDLNIAYTDWQRQMMSEHDELFRFMPVLYHGFDANKYFPMDKKEARMKLIDLIVEKNDGEGRDLVESRLLDRFMIYFVGTNQFRKDLPCLFRAYKLFNDEFPESVLFPHTSNVPMGNNGWLLTNLQVLTEVKDAIIMNNTNTFTDEEMNIFYNAADVLAYPTRGEGFGLPSLEAMAVKTPVIATNFGPQSELHARGRGYFIEIRDVIPGDIAAWTYYVLPDHRSLYKQLKFVYENPEHAKETAETAYEWAKQFTWENQAKELDEILSRIPSGEESASNVQAT